MPPYIAVLGIFVADATFRTCALPRMGQTLLGTGFALGPGGKGSNQAVAAAKAGAQTQFITRLGQDTFADLALETWRAAGVTPAVHQGPDDTTGAACILVNDQSGDNAIVVYPGAATNLTEADVDARADLISNAAVFVTQLEQPLDVARRGLEIARAAGVTTVLNPAPAAALPPEILSLCDYITPNETETEALVGRPVTTVEDALEAARALRAHGPHAAIITLGAQGAVLSGPEAEGHMPALAAGPVIETTGAGDAFNGGFATALAEGRAPMDAVRFGIATASLSVTRAGAAASMPGRAEIDALLARNRPETA